ncbi:MAG: ureidoglycolate hydrolase [bacterium]|nr:ureidoglycolate hydrolase [bacterium]
MRTVQVQELQIETFLPFGFYADMIDPDSEKIGAPPIEFFRDMLQQELGNAGRVSFSTCRVEARELIIDVSEYHSTAGEGILPLDNDVLIHVAPATPDAQCPLNKIAVFRVPQGTMVVLRPGVWHHAPFTTDGRPANTFIVLPERLYANDCHVFELETQDRIKIDV